MKNKIYLIISCIIGCCLSKNIHATDYNQTVPTPYYTNTSGNYEFLAGDNLFMEATDGVGLKIFSGTLTNSGTIMMNSTNQHAIESYVGSSIIENKGSITSTNSGNTAVYLNSSSIVDTTVFTNSNIINVSGNNSVGVYADGSSITINNSGTISVSGTSSVDVLLNNGATFYNQASGVININTAVDVKNIIDKGYLYNKGTITYNSDINFDNLGYKYVADAGGTINGKTLSGTVYVNTANCSSVLGSLCTINSTINGDNTGIYLVGLSPMYTNFSLNGTAFGRARDSFTGIIKNNRLVKYFNWHNGDLSNNSKDTLYDYLMHGTSAEEIDRVANSAVANNIYPTLQELNYNSISNMNKNFDKNLSLKSFKSEGLNYIAAFDYKNSKGNATDTTLETNSNLGVFNLGLGKEFSTGILGGVLSGGKEKSEFVNGDYARSNSDIYQLNLFNIKTFNEKYKWTISPFYGVINGTVTRELYNGDSSTADADVKYYGLFNSLERQYNLENYYLIPKFQFYTAKILQDEIRESNTKGATINSVTTTTAVSTLGGSIGKSIKFIYGKEEYLLDTKVYANYNHEFGYPNRNSEAYYNGMETHDTVALNKFNMRKDYENVGTRLTLKKDDFTLFAEYNITLGTETDYRTVSGGLSYKM